MRDDFRGMPEREELAPPPELARPSAGSAERLRSRFEAWNAQIERLLEALPKARRRSGAVARLIEQHRRVCRKVAAWSGGTRARRELEREWARLKRAWSRTLDAVEIPCPR